MVPRRNTVIAHATWSAKLHQEDLFIHSGESLVIFRTRQLKQIHLKLLLSKILYSNSRMPKSFLVKQRKICKQLKEDDMNRSSDEGKNVIQKFIVSAVLFSFVILNVRIVLTSILSPLSMEY